MLQIIHIRQVHQGIRITEAVAVLLGTAVPLHAVEQCQGQNLKSNDTLPVEIIGPHAPEDVEHLIHGIEHHARAHPHPFLVAGCTCFTIICRHLEVGETFIYVPPKMLIVFAQRSVGTPPKDGAKPVNKNQII